jgi:hypothetical protein
MTKSILDDRDNYIDVIPGTFSDKPMSPMIAKENLGLSVDTQPLIKELDVASAVDCLAEALRNDPKFAYTWQSNIAVAMMDEGVQHEVANRGAIRFLSRLMRDFK